MIEAPAGYGKTQEAVQAAETIAAGLPKGRYVLFLTHTNAARETFNRRLTGRAAVMKTIHSLAGELVDLYAGPLGLPRPLEPFHGRPSFADMVTRAISVLRRRPEVARGLALRYPVILVDEYQDCTAEQAELVDVVAAAAAIRLRLFGDDLQAIYEFAGAPVDFAALTKRHPTTSLGTPWRWREQPGMRDFVVKARRALVAGVPIDLRRPPSCVTVAVWDGKVPGPNQEGHAPECIAALRARLSRHAVVLTHYNAHALGLRRKLPGYGPYHEGADYEPAKLLLDQVVESVGNPTALIGLLVTAMQRWGQGMTQPYRDQVRQICTPDGIQLGAKKKVAAFAKICEELYREPTAACWLRCLRGILAGDHGIPGWRVLRGDQLFLLSRLRPGPEDDPIALLNAASHARSAAMGGPSKGFMVIHKAKGLQFDEVALPYCAGSLFGLDLASRRRMYVAISRAQHRLLFLIPRSDPTPLLRL